MRLSLALLAWVLALPVVSLAQDVTRPSGPGAAMIVPELIGPRTYGTAAKTFLTLSPSNFRPERSTLTYQNNDNQVGVGHTMSRTGGEIFNYFRAPLHLPEGALVTEVEFVFCDTSPTEFFQAEFLIQPRLGNATGQPLIISSGTPGCVDQTATLSPSIQIDNSANYYEVLILLSAANTTIQFASARVGYLLQVSPAPATATFNDVPTSHPFFQFIEALVAAGITSGCSASPPLYCPDNPLTRGQMAVFLGKALGLQFDP